MHSLYRLLLLFVMGFLTQLGAQDVETYPSPLKLESGWWGKLIEGSASESETRLRGLLQSLTTLEAQIPEESRPLVQVAIQKMTQNIEQYLELRVTKGWMIKEAPTHLESYTIDQLLDAAKQLKLSQIDLANATDKLKGLEAILQQANKLMDGLVIEYAGAAENSLQKTLSGLSLMVAVTSRAVVEERVRLAKEKCSALDQGLLWNQEVLKKAQERLNPASIDIQAVDALVEEAEKQKHNFQKELLRIEAELIPADSNKKLNERALMAINNLISHSRSQVQVIAAHAEKSLATLNGKEMGSEDLKALLDTSKKWLKEVDYIEDQAGEWRRLIRREQDDAERLLTSDESASGITYGESIAYQRIVREVLANLESLNIELFQVSTLVNLLPAHTVEHLSWFASFWERTRLMLEEVFARASTGLFYPLFRVNGVPVTLFKLLRGLFILLFAFWFSRFVQRMQDRFVKGKPHMSGASLYTFKRVTHYLVLTVGVISSLGSVGIDFSSLLIIAGALSVGIGFGLQGIVNNFLGGLIILFDRKLRVGDLVELCGGEIGYLTEVNVQNTVIRTLTGHDVLVPNSDIITRQLTNWTLRDQYARFHLPFGVAYGSDKEKVKAVIENAARSIEETVTNHSAFPDPSVWLVGFGDNALNFELVVWVDFRKCRRRASSIRAAYYWEMETALREGGIEIPFPQRDIHIKSGLEKMTSQANGS